MTAAPSSDCSHPCAAGPKGLFHVDVISVLGCIRLMAVISHLRRLEAESIHIMREVEAEFANPVMLYPIGPRADRRRGVQQAHRPGAAASRRRPVKTHVGPRAGEARRHRPDAGGGSRAAVRAGGGGTRAASTAARFGLGTCGRCCARSAGMNDSHTSRTHARSRRETERGERPGSRADRRPPVPRRRAVRPVDRRRPAWAGRGAANGHRERPPSGQGPQDQFRLVAADPGRA